MRQSIRIMPYVVVMISVLTAIMVGITPPASITIDVGGDQRTLLRYFDEPFITNFNPPEPAEWPTTEQPRRWSKSQWRVQWPNAGSGWWIQHITVNTTPRPSDNPAQIEFLSPHIDTVVLPRDIRHLNILSKSTQETPRITAQMPALAITGDNRDLGIVITQIGITPLNNVIRTQQALSIVTLLCAVAIAGYFIIGPWWWTSLFITNLLVIASVQSHAEWWLVHTHTIIASTCIGLMIILCASLFTKSVFQRRVISAISISIIAQLVIVNSLWLRSSDIGMHVRMLNQVLSGDLFFTAQLPCEAGAQLAPYPVISYLFAAPFAGLSDARWWQITVLQSMPLLLHGGAIWYMAYILHKEFRFASWAAIGWSLLATANPFLIRAINIGEISNVWAHAIYLVAVMSWFDKRLDWRIRSLLSVLVVLSHTGITLTYMATMAGYSAWQYFATRRIPFQQILILIASISIAVLVYYGQFVATVLASPRFEGCPPNYPLTIRFSTIGDSWIWPIVIASVAGGIVAIRASLNQIIVIGASAAIAAFALLVLRDQTVRWALAFMPFAMISGSYFLYHLCKKQRAGIIVCGAVVAYSLWLIFAERWEFMIQYLHM